MYDNITVFTHSAIRIAGEKVLYFDPFQMTEEPCDADILFVTHDHYDHWSPEDAARVIAFMPCPGKPAFSRARSPECSPRRQGNPRCAGWPVRRAPPRLAPPA